MDAADAGSDGGFDSGLAPGNCTPFAGGNSMCTSNGLPKYFYLCTRGDPPPASSCVHPPSSVDNHDSKYCCADAVCTHQDFSDDICVHRIATPHSVQCQDDAIVPAGCITVKTELVNHCCP
jgi:hypothetical protein